jgi:hypothetical protein
MSRNGKEDRMKKLTLVAALAAAAIATPAQASNPPTTHKCAPQTVGFKTHGTLIAALLVQQSDGGYSGTIEANVTKANHHAGTGDQTYNLDDATVRFHHGVDSTLPAPGSRVFVRGKLTKLPQHCDQTGFTPTMTVKRVDVSQAAH